MTITQKRKFKVKVWHLLVAAPIIGFIAAAAHTAIQEAQAEKKLEQYFPARQDPHADCQYPLRTTNPPDGCDNSDPCDPAAAAKGESGDCSVSYKG